MAAILHHQHAEKLSDILKALAVIAVPWILVLGQPDLGTSLVFGAITLGMLYWAKAKLGWIILALSPLFSVILSNIPLADPVDVITYSCWGTFLAIVAALSFRKKILAMLGAIAINMGIGALGQQAWGLLKDYQKDRIILFLDPEKDPLGGGYHLIQSRIAIGSGGWFGQGLTRVLW